MKSLFTLSAIVLASAMAASSAHAVVNVEGFYRLGETEGGIVGNATLAAQDDSPANNHYLNNQSGNTYSNNVSFAASQATGSTTSVAMNGSSGGYFGITTPFSNNNVGVELFVETNNANKNNNFLAGTLANSGGIGLAQNGTQWQGLLGNVAFFGSAPVKVDQWAHLAIVRDNGLSTFYVNGVARATNGSNVNITNVPHMGVVAGGSVRFGGTLDEVRMFNFAPTTFNPADLLINQNLTSDLSNGSFENVTGNQADSWNVLGNVVFGGGEGVSDGGTAAIFNSANQAPNAEVMQTFETVAGGTYEVEFDFGKFATGNGTAELTVDVFGAFDFINVANFIASDSSGAGAADVFDTYTFRFIAGADHSTLRFTDTSQGTNSFDAILDRVSVKQIIPEPTSALLGMLGMGALGLRRRRNA